MSRVAVRVALLTAGLVGVAVGVSLAVVGLLADAPPILGFGAGGPQVLLGTTIALLGAAAMWAAMRSARAEGPGLARGPDGGPGPGVHGREEEEEEEEE